MAFLHREKKREEPRDLPPNIMPPAQAPTDQVLALRQQGYTDDQISQNLQQQGYDISQINEAMNQAGPQSYPQQPSAPQQEQYQQQYSQPQIGEEQIQEIAETIINEKWDELSKDMKAVIDWKEKNENKVTQLQQQITDIRNDIQSLKGALLGKVSEYDKNISGVGTEIKAMEKVFQKVLPSLTESVNKLERMSKKPKTFGVTKSTRR